MIRAGSHALLPLSVLVGACVSAPPVVDTQSDCPATHARVGQSAELTTRFHRVSGTARIVDDCTIVIENFTYDGLGIDVRVVAALDANFGQATPVSNNLVGPAGYDNQTLIVKLPVGVTLDDVAYISIWCATAQLSLGDGAFE